MTDDQGLYRAVLENADDDLPRLAFADWLDENGPSPALPWSAVEPFRLAALIRAQIDSARSPDDEALRAPTWHRGEDATGQPWLSGLPALPPGLEWAAVSYDDSGRSLFRRGFPAGVLADDGRAFVDGAAELFATAPVEVVAFRAMRQQEARPLAECEWLSRLVRIEFVQGLSSAAARRLFQSPHLSRLEELFLGPEMTVIETARAVVRSPAFRRLRTLSCRDDRRAGGSLVEELSQMANPPALRRLFLASNRINAERAARLVAAPALAAVEELDLGDNSLGPEGTGAVAAAGLPHLRRLHLGRTWPGTEGVAALSRAPATAALRSLSLEGNLLDPAAAEAMVAGTWKGLRQLNLSGNRLGDRGAEALARMPASKGLFVLDLSDNRIEDSGAAALADSPFFDSLRHLNLTGNAFANRAQARLVERFGEGVVWLD